MAKAAREKQWRKDNPLTDEQKAAKVAKEKKRRQQMTDEQKAAMYAKERQRRQQMTDEQKAAKVAKKRQRRQQMSDEQKAAMYAKENQRRKGVRKGAAKLQGMTAKRWEPSALEDFHSQINEFLEAEKDLSKEALNDLLA